MKFVWPWMLAAVSGLLMALALPPFEWSALVWVALVPLTVALWFGPAGKWRPLRLLGLGYVAGLVFFWVAFFWITEVTGAGWFALAFYLALFPALWALFAGTVCRPRPLDSNPASAWTHSFRNLRLGFRAAAAWAGLEWARGTLFTGFGWNQLGTALWQNTPLIQIADVTGVGGLSFLIVLTNLILVITAKRLSVEVGRQRLRPHYDFTLTLALIAAAFSYGVVQFTLPRGQTAPLSVAAVQANIPQDQKWDAAFEQHILETYARLSRVAIAQKPDLLIWPEAATPRPLLNDADMQAFVGPLLKDLGSDLLLGTINYSYDGAYNAAVLLAPDGTPQVYHKIHLVPFGEYVPLRRTFPLFAWIVGDLVPSDFNAGKDPVVMMTKGHRKYFKIAPLICFEDTLGELTRQFARRGAEVLVTVTNDGWFRRSAGSRQHLANAVFRSVETKLPLVRAANTGVTCIVDRLGRVTHVLAEPGGDTFIEGVLFGTFDVTLQPRQTFYTCWGDIFSLACLFAALLSIRVHLLSLSRRDVSEN